MCSPFPRAGCYWFEGANSRNWTFEGNTIQGVNYGPAKISPLGGDVYLANCAPFIVNGKPSTNGYIETAVPMQTVVTISNNAFYQGFGESAVVVYGGDTVTFTGNTVAYTNSSPPAADFACYNCTGATITNNTCGRAGGCVVIGG